MGQPGNASINHASIANYWNYNYNNLARNSSYNFFFLNILKSFLTLTTKYGLSHTKLFLYSLYFFDNKDERLDIDEQKFFRKIRIFSRLLKMARYYKIRRRVASYLNSKFWIYKYNDWFVIHWYAFRVFDLIKNTPKLPSITTKGKGKFRKNLYFKFLVLQKLKVKGINLNLDLI